MSLPPVPNSPHKSGPTAERAWFYERGEKESGPWTFRELREAAARGDFVSADLIRRDGEKPRPAGFMLGLFPKQSRAPRAANPAPAGGGSERNEAAENLYAPPAAANIMDGPPGGLYLPHLRKSPFSLLVFLLLAGAAVLAFALSSPHESTRIMFTAFGGILCLLWAFTALVYLHRAWDMMAMLGAPLSGSKAVSWMLVPLFNAVWSFIALAGWARLWNRNVKNHPGLALADRVFLPGFVLFSVSLLAAQVWLVFFWVEKVYLWDMQNRFLQVGAGIAGALLVTSLLTWWQLCHSINFLARKKS